MAPSAEDMRDELVVPDEKTDEEEGDPESAFERDDDPGCTVEGGVVRLG